MNSFGKRLNLDIVSGLILDILIDLPLILLLHVFNPRNDLLIQVALVIKHLQLPLIRIAYIMIFNTEELSRRRCIQYYWLSISFYDILLKRRRLANEGNKRVVFFDGSHNWGLRPG